jgi:hypothetical protein
VGSPMNEIESWFQNSCVSSSGNSQLTSESSSRTIRILEPLTAFPLNRSCGSPFTKIAGVVMETISPTLFLTKNVFLHECIAIMPSPILRFLLL